MIIIDYYNIYIITITGTDIAIKVERIINVIKTPLNFLK